MPLYDLRCESCETSFEAMASIADKTKNLIPCPNCGSFDIKSVYKVAPHYIKRDRAPQCPGAARGGCQGCRHA